MDELQRIESIYGSVAEWRRQQIEEEQEEYEPTEEELEEEHRRYAEYCLKRNSLNGRPSPKAIELYRYNKKHEVNREDFSEYNDYVRACHKHAHDNTLKCFHEIVEYHNLKVSDDSYQFDTNTTTFALSVDYTEFSTIKHLKVRDLDYETFKKVYTDLDFLGFYLFWNYRDENNKDHYSSNEKMGDLRIRNLKYLKFENDEDINKHYEEFKNKLMNSIGKYFWVVSDKVKLERLKLDSFNMNELMFMNKNNTPVRVSTIYLFYIWEDTDAIDRLASIAKF